jgi:hypothetical protein
MVQQAEELLASQPDWSKAEARHQLCELIGFFNAMAGKSRRRQTFVQPPVYQQLTAAFRRIHSQHDI